MEITDTPLLVGRGPHCGLVIDDPSVSSSHAEVVRRNGVVFVRDLNSTNGTNVDGRAVTGETILPPGGAVQFGLMSYMLSGTELIEAGANAGRTQIIGGSRRSGAQDQSNAGQSTVPPPPPPTRPQVQKPNMSGVTGWLRGLLWGYVGAVGAMALAVVLMFVYFEQYMSSPFSSANESRAIDNWSNWETIYGVIYIVSLIVTIPIFVLLIIWAHRAHRASNSFEPGERKWGSGWAVGAWFIPIASYVLLPLILAEIHKIVSAPRSQGRADRDWPRLSTPATLILWFAFYAIGGVVFAVGDLTLGDPFIDADGYRVGLIATLVGLGLTAAAALLGSGFVKDVSDKVEQP